MVKVIIKHLIIIYLSMLPVLSPCANKIISNDTNEIQDSILLNFNQKISDANGDSIKQMKIYFEYGEHFDEKGKPEKSIEQLNTALRIARNINDNAKVATIGNYLANMYAAIGNLNASNDAYLLALDGAEKTNNSGEIAKISMNLASNYNYAGDYKKAIKHGLYALKIKETKNNLERICYHYIAMGNIFRENNNNAKWEDYVQKAYKMKDIEGCASFGDIAKIYNSLGGIEVQKEEFENALLYYDTLMTISREANYDLGICSALTNRAGVYKQLKNFNKALELSTESEKYFGDNPYDIIFNNNFKAELYNLTGLFKKGLALVNENIKTNEINDYSTEKIKCLELLYELNLNLTNYDEAFFWNDSLRNTEKWLRDEDIRQTTEELETKYETEKKVQQIAILETKDKLKSQRINIGIFLLTVLFVITVMLLYILQIRKRQAILRQNEIGQQLLRSQMNPHFLFNALGSIQNFMLKNEANKAAGYLNNFALLTRSILEHSAQEFVSVSDEINTLRNFIELEKMRLENSFDFEINYNEELELDFINIPPMLIQPFVENAIKHGFNNLDYKGLLQLKFEEKDSVLHIEITDNGIGINHTKEDTSKTHRSMSMKIFEQRRIVLAKRTKQPIGLEVYDRQNLNDKITGTLVKISIPILT
jgi:tetratricopeptide (TPR) repeat protein